MASGWIRRYLRIVSLTSGGNVRSWGLGCGSGEGIAVASS